MVGSSRLLRWGVTICLGWPQTLNPTASTSWVQDYSLKVLKVHFKARSVLYQFQIGLTLIKIRSSPRPADLGTRKVDYFQDRPRLQGDLSKQFCGPRLAASPAWCRWPLPVSGPPPRCSSASAPPQHWWSSMARGPSVQRAAGLLSWVPVQWAGCVCSHGQ
jgi:hypothetical protein